MYLNDIFKRKKQEENEADSIMKTGALGLWLCPKKC